MQKTISVSSARQRLMRLTEQVHDHMDNFVLTNKGRSQAVLLSVAEYQSLKAAAQLLRHPEVLESMNQARAQIAEGRGLTLEQAFDKPKKKAAAGAI